MTISDPIVAYVEFLGGIMRPVFEDAIGQYVVADDGASTPAFFAGFEKSPVY